MQLTDKSNPNYPKSSTDFSTNQSKWNKTQMLSPKFIQALTPIFIALIGASIGIICIINNSESFTPSNRSQAMGLASTAIAGAAGLAQSKEEK